MDASASPSRDGTGSSDQVFPSCRSGEVAHAVGEAELLVVPPSVFWHLFEHEPNMIRVLLRFVRERLLARLLSTHRLFTGFSPPERAALAEQFRFLEIESDAELIQKGDPPKGLYLLMTGSADVLSEERVVARLESGDLFGEMSLLRRQPAVATVRTTSRCFALELPEPRFREPMTHPQLLEYVSTVAQERQAEADQAGGPSHTDGHLARDPNTAVSEPKRQP